MVHEIPTGNFSDKFAGRPELAFSGLDAFFGGLEGLVGVAKSTKRQELAKHRL